MTTTYGDVVNAIDGRKVTGYEDLVSYIFNSTEVGQVVSLTILRDGEQMTVQVTLQADYPTSLVDFRTKKLRPDLTRGGYVIFRGNHHPSTRVVTSF